MAASRRVQRGDTILHQTLQKMIDQVPDQSKKCIYKVPKLLRGLNPEAYTPMAVPIGPLHQKVDGQDSSQVDDPEFNSHGLYKLICLKSFLQQSDQYKLDDYKKTVKGGITEIHNCYAYSDKIFNDDDDIFTEMVLLDCVFIIQLFKEHSQHWKGTRSISMPPLKLEEIASDLLLVENQLPLFILELLYSQNPSPGSFIDISCEFLKISSKNVTTNKLVPGSTDPSHLLDIFRISLLPPPQFQPNNSTIRKTRRKTEDDQGIDLQKMMIPTATSLFEAGIKFKVNDQYNYSILDICFDKENGILSIPKIWLGHGGERKFRNLIAFEQSHTKDYTYVTDYQFFLDCLINSPTDVQLLVKAGIIENWLGSETILCELVNSVGKHAYHFRGGYLYSHIAIQLNAYHRREWNRYKAILMQVYFSHPWAIIPVGYAGALLLLTIIQVVVGILALPVLNKPGPGHN